ncbi:MAG: hypothetical protein GC154_16315 [bacterium]|nr:hypothetical protein [bacterium]
MCKQFSRILIAVAVFTFVGVVPAAHAQGVKIGVIDMLEIFQKTDKLQAISKQYKESLDKKNKELADKKQELNDKIEKLQVQRELMPKETYEKQKADLQSQIQNFGEYYQTEQKALDDKKTELLKPVLEELRGVVGEVAKAKGFSIIIKKEYVAFSEDSLDITSEVVTRMNAKK